MIKVFIAGVWDVLHIGHVRVLQRAAELGDWLRVGVVTDEMAQTYKPTPAMTFEERRETVAALRCVDEVVPFREWGDMDAVDDCVIRVASPTHGWLEAQRETEIALTKRGIKYVRLPRTPGISSTIVKERIREL